MLYLFGSLPPGQERKQSKEVEHIILLLYIFIKLVGAFIIIIIILDDILAELVKI
jgi:hypothetical protein